MPSSSVYFFSQTMKFEAIFAGKCEECARRLPQGSRLVFETHYGELYELD
jgi:hypothetical protein